MFVPSIVLLWFNFLLNKHVDYINCNFVCKDYVEIYYIYAQDQFMLFKYYIELLEFIQIIYTNILLSNLYLLSFIIVKY